MYVHCIYTVLINASVTAAVHACKHFDFFMGSQQQKQQQSLFKIVHGSSSFTQATLCNRRCVEDLESPRILLWHFPGLESPGKGLLVLESAGNLLNSVKNLKCMADSKEN